MTYRISPAKRRQKALHDLLNKGHRFAVMEGVKVICSARWKHEIERQAHWIPGRKVVEIAAELEALPCN
ncbi:hypothetical protein ZL54_22485 [Salmonella enterica subsp. enterica]|nr:hypothetical protein [Salmonella enterica subsp. enterica]EEJ7209106.1 hypothetical protein [Salmonella enterica subsp. enterica]